MFKKILVANRGEIAVRIIRTCKKLGIKTVSICSFDDKNSLHSFLSDENFFHHSRENVYLDSNFIIDLAKRTNCQAIHPGYGFLSENYDFAKKIEDNNLVFIGPSSDLIKKCGNKLESLNIAKKNDLKILPSCACIFNNDSANIFLARKIGYPLLVKSVFGGGGKGIRFVNEEKELINSIFLSNNESFLSFNNNSSYMEKYIYNSRHLEFQIFGDGKNVFIIGERDCSIQRNYQKIIEETPIVKIDKKKIKILKQKCEIFLKSIKYDNIGTIEFLYDNNNFFFIEINPRVQVEHTITESINNFDIIEAQIYLSYKKKINFKDFKFFNYGHSIQCRINIEGFCNNKIKFLHIPGGPGIRFDSHIYSGYEIPFSYDKMIGKLIVVGKNRIDAINKMIACLDEIIIYGIETNITYLLRVLSNDLYKKNKIHTNFLLDLK